MLSVKDLKVLTYRWHCAHQYELWKLGFEVHLWHKDGYTLNWDSSSRPMPSNARKVTPEEADGTNYDLVILHFDENVLTPAKTHGRLHKNWGAPLKVLKDHKGPKVAICHGTPPLRGRFDMSLPAHKVCYDDEDRKELVDFMGDIPVVCNSNQALKDWGFKNGRVIWHGIDPDEFVLSGEPKINDALMILSNVSWRPWYQGYFFAKEVLQQDIPHRLLGNDETGAFNKIKLGEGNKYQSYLQVLQSSLILMNPTLFSPMPRSRIEAAMSGACIVTTNYQDESLWIRQGETGFYTNSIAEMRDILQFLLKNPDKAQEVGLKGRELYSKIFHVKRYLAEWRELINGII